MSRIDTLQIVADMSQSHIADSINQVHIADSLHQFFVADSLHQIFVADSIIAARLATQRAIFGDESTLCESTLCESTHHVAQIADKGVGILSSNYIYIILAVVFLLFYLIWLPHIIRNGTIRWSYLKRRHRHISSEGDRDVIGRQRMGIQSVAWLLFATLFSMIIARGVAQYSHVIPDFSGSTWIAMALIAVAGVAMYEILILHIGGYLSLNMEFIHKILSTKRQYMILGVIFVSPIFIISSIANYNQGEWVLQLAGIVGVIFILMFLRQSFLLFVRQNFSILHWFLYLCGVEILPLTFIWAIMTRYLIS